ncbi:Spermidine/putrescine-binding protein [Methanosarcina siciliae T4/M]|uniref:Spermidine/putrescine-binding protein n=2 Tax=Methanosarcina siciliae TaxID=38027 RepID=A0A0E3PBM3_9EURY|nr:ABC transporter substrate-binding protein [Methanosarcina siciliae]AKB27681.1 Spermidine/putrescine-binding protein [Methanosarcina siciliae T4/M]AKB31618.1 Spermidine/putrescine-binding protein [Methanosarcina siciliae HI350]
MKVIDETMSIYQILSEYPFLLKIFEQHGMEKFGNREILEKLGPLLKLKTALSMVSVNENSFIELLNQAVSDSEAKGDFTLADSPERQKELTLLALLPCGMKMPFSRAFDDFSAEYSRQMNNVLHSLVEGNVNHELSYYAYIDSVTSIDELPDIIISSDINSFYHKPFQENFLNQEYFVNLNSSPMNIDFESIGFADPRRQFTMISANLLVLVTIDELMKDNSKPESWEDILKAEYRNRVVMRGQDGFFCNGVLLPFYRLYGMEGIKKLASSVYTGLHPSEMVKMIDSKKDDVPPMYIMPYFFAKKIQDKSRITINIPSEGAIVSPVQMLVKKSAAERVKELTDFFCGKKFAEISTRAFFPTTNPEVNNKLEGIKLYWLGWDFLINTDIGKLKEELEEVFNKSFYETGGVV